jgi:hypothetical protein
MLMVPACNALLQYLLTVGYGQMSVILVFFALKTS